VRAGKMRCRVHIQSQAATPVGSRGQMTASWVDDYADWAEIVILSGREGEVARQLYAEATVRITLRYREGLTEKKRIRYGARFFQIGLVNNVEERNREHECLCSESRSP
jgi:SPP1 family predicted phage head-tail adaptor